MDLEGKDDACGRGDGRGSDGASTALTYGEKLRCTDRDARRTVAALCAVVVVWLACGFGLSSFDVKVLHVPLWVVAGLLGTWVAAIVAAVVLARSFRDFPLEDEGTPADGQADAALAGCGAMPADEASADGPRADEKPADAADAPSPLDSASCAAPAAADAPSPLDSAACPHGAADAPSPLEPASGAGISAAATRAAAPLREGEVASRG